MDRYKGKLVKNIRVKLGSWLDGAEPVGNEELYRFLHSIAGTAATIGLDNVGEEARSLMEQLDEKEVRFWEKEELKTFLLPLISIFYQEEYSSTEEFIKHKKEGNDQKLILLIDDDPLFLMNLKDLLQEHGWSVIATADPDNAIETFYDLHPDCLIVNDQLKGTDGHDVLERLLANKQQGYTPTVVIGRKLTRERRVASYRLGADDVLGIPFDEEEFFVRVNRQLERKQTMDAVMLIDELTKVYNRKYLQQSYEYLINNLKRRNEVFSLALLDLDHFKSINDRYGHIVGDQVLVSFAAFLKNGLRMGDTIIRYGGEEFLVLLPDTGALEAKAVLDRILAAFSQQSFESGEGGQAFKCTFSAGVFEVAATAAGLKENLEIVDATLYEAKNEGRNRVKVVPGNKLKRHKRTIRVGIVDDDPIIRMMLTDLISKGDISEEFNVDLRVFTDGMEFDESKWYSESNEPYLFILDGVMPRMDGIEVLQKLRGLPNQRKFTIIMLTSRKSEHDIARAIQLGADDYITKPFKLLELETRINHLMRRMK